MSERIITLFGEELVPEQTKPAAKSRAKKKQEEIAEEPKELMEESADTVETPARPVAETTQAKKIKDETKEILVLPDDWKGGDKQYYTIGEVAELFKVKTSHIRFWTNEFKLNVRTTRKGDRLYTNEQIKELRAIHHLVKERGFTLTGAKAKLKTQNKMDVETVDLKKSLTSLRNKLVAIKSQLK